MGVQKHDPDHTYELTTDNVKKILAILMRFRYVSIFNFFEWVIQGSRDAHDKTE